MASGDTDKTCELVEALFCDNERLRKRVMELEAENAAKRIRSIVASGPNAGQEAGRLTLSGDYALWRRRNTGHVDTSSLLQILSTKGSKGLVLRSERRGGAAHFILGREKLETAVRDTAQFAVDVPRSWAVIVIHTDAFSSSTARTDSFKHQVTQVSLFRLSYAAQVIKVRGAQPVDAQQPVEM